MTNTVAWDMTLCSLVGTDETFRGTCRYKTIYQTAWRHIPKYHSLNAAVLFTIQRLPEDITCICFGNETYGSPHFEIKRS
jgi:hypothetical protein